MHRILPMCFDAALAAVFLYPLFLLLEKKYFHNRRMAMRYFAFSVYLSGMFAVAGLPNILHIRFEPILNLTPFAYMFSDYTASLLNVALFVPLGIALPMFWTRFQHPLKTVLFGFCTSLLVELLQMFSFRATDINDLITNTLGTLLGWCAGRLILFLRPKSAPMDQGTDVFMVCGAAFGVMFFLQPFLADFIRFLFCAL